MVVLSEDEKNIPICDTNILISFGLEKILNEFIEFNKEIFVADNVIKELENKFQDNRSYEFLVNNIKENDNVNIINKDEYFTKEKIMVMVASLSQYEISENTLLKGETCKDSGEFISAIYAANLGIKKFITNDMKFRDRYAKEFIFKDILFINMVQALDSFVGKEKRKVYVKSIKDKSKKMNEELNQEKVLKKLDLWMKKLA